MLQILGLLILNLSITGRAEINMLSSVGKPVTKNNILATSMLLWVKSVMA